MVTTEQRLQDYSVSLYFSGKTLVFNQTYAISSSGTSGRTSGERLSDEVGCTTVGQTDGQTDGHPTVIIRACDGGRFGGTRLPSSKTDRHTD